MLLLASGDGQGRHLQESRTRWRASRHPYSQDMACTQMKKRADTTRCNQTSALRWHSLPCLQEAATDCPSEVM